MDSARKNLHLVYDDLGFGNNTLTTPVHTENIEPNYEAYKIVGHFIVSYKGNSGYNQRVISYFHFGDEFIGGEGYYCQGSGTCNTNYIIDGVVDGVIDLPVQNSIQFHYRYKKVGLLDGSFSLYTRILPAAYEAWQTSIYQQLQQAYAQLQAEYEDETAMTQAGQQMEAAQNEEDKGKNIHPMMKRVIEQRELKRACIEMITRPFCKELGKKLYDDLAVCKDKYNIPQIQLTNDLDNYATQVKFFEQAFEWETMAYLFYPYYWADKCDWGDLFQQEDDDLIFQAFKQAGMAKVLVPVRPDLSETVLYYLETGDIWLGGNLVAETEDDTYLSIAADLQVLDKQVEQEWETRVPTTLTLLQAESAIVEESGLPCCHKVETNEVVNPIKESNSRLQLLPTNADTGNETNNNINNTN